MEKFDRVYELAKLYADKGDFEQSIPRMRDAAAGFLCEKDFAKFLSCQNLLLRMHAEREEFDQINEIKDHLHDLVLKEGFDLNSKTYYTLALCASYKGQNETALDYLQKALNLGLSNDSKPDICYAISGLAIVYDILGRQQDALKELYNLQVFFEVMPMPDLQLAMTIVNANILRKIGKYEQAIDILWQAHELSKNAKHMTTYIYLLFSMGVTYMKMGDKDMASLYLNLAHRSTDPKNLKHLSKSIQKSLDELGIKADQNFDLVFDLDKHTVFEKKLGKIDLKNQFILLDLLKLFAQNQGEVYSKEYLVEHVWKQSYDPSVHDNKIYVTIKRLGKLIEPDFDRPRYIFRAKNGYFMNKSARVHIEHQSGMAHSTF